MSESKVKKSKNTPTMPFLKISTFKHLKKPSSKSMNKIKNFKTSKAKIYIPKLTIIKEPEDNKNNTTSKNLSNKTKTGINSLPKSKPIKNKRSPLPNLSNQPNSMSTNFSDFNFKRKKESMKKNWNSFKILYRFLLKISKMRLKRELKRRKMNMKQT